MRHQTLLVLFASLATSFVSLVGQRPAPGDGPEAGLANQQAHWARAWQPAASGLRQAWEGNDDLAEGHFIAALDACDESCRAGLARLCQQHGASAVAAATAALQQSLGSKQSELDRFEMNAAKIVVESWHAVRDEDARWLLERERILTGEANNASATTHAARQRRQLAAASADHAEALDGLRVRFNKNMVDAAIVHSRELWLATEQAQRWTSLVDEALAQSPEAGRPVAQRPLTIGPDAGGDVGSESTTGFWGKVRAAQAAKASRPQTLQDQVTALQDQLVALQDQLGVLLRSAKDDPRLAELQDQMKAVRTESQRLANGLAQVVGNGQAGAELLDGEVHERGLWSFHVTEQARGSLAALRTGRLSFDGKDLPNPVSMGRYPLAAGDYFETPWGRIYWLAHTQKDVAGWWPDAGLVTQPGRRIDSPQDGRAAAADPAAPPAMGSISGTLRGRRKNIASLAGITVHLGEVKGDGDVRDLQFVSPKADGTFEFTNVPPGNYVVNPTFGGKVETVTFSRQVELELKAGEKRTGVDFRVME